MNYLKELIKKYSRKEKVAGMPPKMRTPLRTIYMGKIFRRERIKGGDSITILAVNAYDDIFLWTSATYIKRNVFFVRFIENRYGEHITLPLSRVITIYKEELINKTCYIAQ